jgi:hypothetical protein
MRETSEHPLQCLLNDTYRHLLRRLLPCDSINIQPHCLNAIQLTQWMIPIMIQVMERQLSFLQDLNELDRFAEASIE